MYWNARQVVDQRLVGFSAATRAAARDGLEVAARKVGRLTADHPDYFPLYTDRGRWKHAKESWTNWCEGFLGGQLWLFHEHGIDEP